MAELNPYRLNLILNKEAKNIHWKNIVFQQIMLEKINILK